MSEEENHLCAKLFSSCLARFKFNHTVHPSGAIAPDFSEYIYIKRARRLRIIHIKPNLNEERISNIESKTRISRSSLSEEYWFTQWNRPLKLGNCNCSFRRSQRYQSYNEKAPPSQTNTTRTSSYIVPPTKITNVETFVERLIQETIFEAFQEYFMSRTDKIVQNGTTNLAFTKDELDGVVLRHPSKIFKPKPPKIKSCPHKNAIRTKKKPTVLLLHGMGSSADVWWNIIDTLIHKGYEIVAPDLLGHGYSSVPDKPPCYKFKSLVKYVLKVFDRYVGCDESKTCIVIGHSYGCSLATALYRCRTQQISQLILISGGGPTPLAPPVGENNENVLAFVRSVLKPLLFCGLKRTFFYSPRGKHFEVCSDDNAIPRNVLKYLNEGQNWPEGDAAFHRRILIPTLLVHGLNDTKVTLVQECEMERTIPRAFLELIPNAGHMCMLETPEHLSHMIMCFIDWWSK